MFCYSWGHLKWFKIYSNKFPLLCSRKKFSSCNKFMNPIVVHSVTSECALLGLLEKYHEVLVILASPTVPHNECISQAESSLYILSTVLRMAWKKHSRIVCVVNRKINHCWWGAESCSWWCAQSGVNFGANAHSRIVLVSPPPPFLRYINILFVIYLFFYKHI